MGNPNGQCPMFPIRAFCNSSSNSIRRSGNISSLQRIGTSFRYNYQQGTPSNNNGTVSSGGRSGQYAATTWGNRNRAYDAAECTIDVSDPRRDRGIIPNDLGFILFGN